jgi:hypothetical protein
VEVRHPAERLLGQPDDEDDRSEDHAEDGSCDQSSDHAEDDTEGDPPPKVTIREQRMLAERIADLWLVPYTEPTFARLARAEHKRLKDEDDKA